MTLLDEDKEVDPIAYVRDKFKIAADVPIDANLAKSKLESDKYIEMVVKQKDELANDYLRLKADYDARAKLEELLNQRQPQDNANNTQNATNQPFDPAEIDKLVDRKLTAREKQRIADENLKKAKEMLREKLGNNYTNTLRSKMEELDLTTEELDAMAARSPKAFMRTLGLEDQPVRQTFQTPPSSQYNSATFKPVTEKRTWSYYQDLKAKNPQAWLDPKIQTQMYHDSQRLGADFADGDFNTYNERLNP